MRPSYIFSVFDFHDALSLYWNFLGKHDNIDENNKDLLGMGLNPRKEAALFMPTSDVKGLPKSSWNR